ncbi:biotin--[acetyl-CoA-carboxylase] ligase [Truepera radiovictrix]|uniref:Biotin/acetyl-CoA-carboxylase ligase n=1 Tax=Truepera radiovictrix (strain DSM 17093 / CIP 108686 / LMG 22925 / RQ-24) TaxID=649638 RepID=D7CXR2_TRURR|nr:biotin--[acetyl-CoA-carboxylase] ligase [Truepera radiovictrix]ADI14664.1 biotin/acetyl-CoA-carboxylase ligase [Truepera radiovictrix DSM 17093]WMT56786.1 biotin--[acetyl-CoA-carboxylase] ligase [Truepera radiovictrix]
MDETVEELALRILAFDRLDSTQDELRRRLEAGEAVHGLVVRARVQESGRGSRARDWASAAGGSYQTLAVRYLAPHPPSYAALVLALGLAQTLPRYGARVQIKWPNDLFYRRQKLAGLLVEALRGHLLIGVGLNVDNPVPPGAVGLRGWDLEAVHAVVLEGLQRGLEHLNDAHFDLPSAFAPFDLLAGGRVCVSTPRGEVTGVADGVDAHGRLRVRDAYGRLHALQGRVRPLP